jgi:hypothetical protein
MQIKENKISELERKRNREKLAEMLLERKKKSEIEMIEDRKNPEYQAIFAKIRLKKKLVHEN